VLIAFASDYGLTDEFVGVCKAVMLGLAPDVRILDVGHEIPAHDVRAGALMLVRAVQYLPDDCVVVAVVDPGVGSTRRLLGVEVAGGVLLGPDNGLLAPAVAMAGGARSVVSLDNLPSDCVLPSLAHFTPPGSIKAAGRSIGMSLDLAGTRCLLIRTRGPAEFSLPCRSRFDIFVAL